jgi:hypothetical protein
MLPPQSDVRFHAQDFVNRFFSRLLPGFEWAVRIMSMRARSVAGG